MKFSNYPLGNSISDKGTVFRFFCPKAKSVELHVSETYPATNERVYEMKSSKKGIWNFHHPDSLEGLYYGYKIIGPKKKSNFFLETNHLIADPYSRHVANTNNYMQYPLTKIVVDDFEWEDDDYVCPDDLRDLVIYEAHLKDMVHHPNAEAPDKGAYTAFAEAKTGGLAHLKKMGVNAVEFLPLQKFAYFEPPYGETSDFGIKNSWNAHSRNHWGYMTSFFFAPETLYSSSGTTKPEKFNGQSHEASHELKNMVKNLHKEGLSVIMDVVYNHSSQYDLNPLKFADKEHYYRLDEMGFYQNDSWTGNDIRTESEYARKLIVDSVCYWMKEYHIDGFRFDLAGLFDYDTIDAIRHEAMKINPKVILIAEPWGGHYKPDGFSRHGWASWNDKLRNGFKGHDPEHAKGFIFGDWLHGMNRFSLENFIRGTLIQGDHGLFQTSAHALNYIEAHDGYTLGDFIRIGVHPKNRNRIYNSTADATRLTALEMKVAKLAAACLFVSQGISMIHSGQEWARAKVIHDPHGLDQNIGKLDHDSYNKDNATNYLDFQDIKLNESLYKYYKGLIKLRLNSPALRKANPENIIFKVYHDPLHITFEIDAPESGDPYIYFISLNGNRKHTHRIDLPYGDWEMVVNEKQAGTHSIEYVHGSYTLNASSAVVFRRLRRK